MSGDDPTEGSKAILTGEAGGRMPVHRQETLEDVFPSLAEAHRHTRDIAHRELAYVIDRRDRFSERVRFGSLALNGASLVALMSALGGKGDAATWLGFTPQTAFSSAVAFTVGIIAAGLSAWAQQNVYMREAGDAVQRAVTYEMMVSRYPQRVTDERIEELGEALASLDKLPLVGFQYSSTAIWSAQVAGGAWLAGILFPLLHAVRWPF